jgi:hypothetical protein
VCTPLADRPGTAVASGRPRVAQQILYVEADTLWDRDLQRELRGVQQAQWGNGIYATYDCAWAKWRGG